MDIRCLLGLSKYGGFRPQICQFWGAHCSFQFFAAVCDILHPASPQRSSYRIGRGLSEHGVPHPVVYHHIAINVPNMVHPPFSGIYTQNWFCNLLIISYPPLYHHFPPFNPHFHGKTTLNHHISCIYPHVIPIYRSFSHDIFLINPLLWPKTRFSKAKDVLGCSADVAWLTAVVGSLLRLFPSEQRVALILKCACRRLDWGACVRLADRGLEDDLW
jgi:hypothetical protein